MKWMLMSLIVLTLGLTACENPFVVEPEDQATETRDVGTYESITINASTDVVLRVGSSGKLKIKSGKSMLKRFKSRVKHGVLEIDLDKGRDDGRRPVLYVSLKSLNYIVNKGSGNIRIELNARHAGDDDDCEDGDDGDDDGDDDDGDDDGNDDSDSTGGDPQDSTGGDPQDSTGGDPQDSTGFDDDSTGVDDDTLSVTDTANVHIGDVTIYILGSGSVELINAAIDHLYSNIRGSGKLILEGEIDVHECDMKGSGDLDALEAPTRVLNIYVSGSGHAAVNVIEMLIATVKGSGIVEYVGDPTLQSVVTGSGSVIKME